MLGSGGNSVHGRIDCVEGPEPGWLLSLERTNVDFSLKLEGFKLKSGKSVVESRKGEKTLSTLKSLNFYSSLSRDGANLRKHETIPTSSTSSSPAQPILQYFAELDSGHFGSREYLDFQPRI